MRVVFRYANDAEVISYKNGTQDDSRIMFMKGAPERVLDCCSTYTANVGDQLATHMDIKIKNKVLIIGGGPSGLTLAQILHRNDVPFEIFERDVDVDSRHGWAVVLAESVSAVLYKLQAMS